MPIIKKSHLNGSVTIPSSKSYVHRFLICAALANKKTILKGLFEGNDIEETIYALRELGIKIEKNSNEILIDSTSGIVVCSPKLCIKESGATSRFILPILATYCNEYAVTIGHRLKERPQEEIEMGQKYVSSEIHSKEKELESTHIIVLALKKHHSQFRG